MTVFITGGNKGIGFQIARKYATTHKNIIITSRNVENGIKAVEELQSEFPNVNFSMMKLDIVDATQRAEVIKKLIENNTKIDILVHNSGFAYKAADAGIVNFETQAKNTNEINYFGTKDLMVEMLAVKDNLFNKNCRILFCSSLVTDMVWPKLSEQMQNAYQSDNILDTIEKLDENCHQFVAAAKAGEQNKLFCESAYGMSKVYVRKMTEILAKSYPDYFWASYCPGWCKSDMAGWDRPPRTTEQGAAIAHWLGTSNDGYVTDFSGKFFKSDDKRTDWGASVSLT